MSAAYDYGPAPCPVCGADMEWQGCWAGCDEGWAHDCGEDCCACAVPEPNEPCPECKGAGGYLECTALPHTDAQMEAYRARSPGR